MATIVNNPPTDQTTGNSFMVIIVLLLIVLAAFVFFAYGLPVMRGSSGTNNTQTEVPQINVPDKIDVNINQPK